MKPPALAVVLALALCSGAAQSQVVADSACEKYAVDIAAFATCDSPTRVARAETEEDATVAPRPPEQKSSETRPPKALSASEKKAPPQSSARKR